MSQNRPSLGSPNCPTLAVGLPFRSYHYDDVVCRLFGFSELCFGSCFAGNQSSTRLKSQMSSCPDFGELFNNRAGSEFNAAAGAPDVGCSTGSIDDVTAAKSWASSSFETDNAIVQQSSRVGPQLPPPVDSNREIFAGFVTILSGDGESDEVMLGDGWDAGRRLEQILHEFEQTTRQREDHYDLEEDWYTPSGRRRHSPQIIATVTNQLLNKYRRIKKSSVAEAVAAAEEQIESWKSQEIRKRSVEGQKAFESIAQQAAEKLDTATKTQWEAVKTILSRALQDAPKLNLESFYSRRPFPDFEFEDKPKQPTYPKKPIRKAAGLLDKILPLLKRWKERQYLSELGDWETKTTKMLELWRIEYDQWKTLHDQAFRAYTRESELYHQNQASRNEAVAEFESAFESGDPCALARYVEACLDTRPYPWVFRVEHEVSYEPQSKTAVVDVSLPPMDGLIDVVGYQFVKSRLAAKPIFQKASDRRRLYESAVEQTVLGTLWKTVHSLPSEQIDAGVVNGWIFDRDPATGLERTTCVVSLSSRREQLENLDLACVDTAECIRNLKGLVAAPFADVAPVAPIMHLNRQDGRFVESRAVLSEINCKTNLAEIGWEDFEHLVRELFSRLFQREGAEVRVTQCSGDGGVDAIAFDPDPIRGGKFVIQAKRYTKVVPVSAVRDLFGTMISEGASKGILVTTSHYGNDSRQFVKDKPITLIDGQNLVHLLEEHGYSVRIDVAAARANQKRNPLAR